MFEHRLLILQGTDIISAKIYSNLQCFCYMFTVGSR